MAADEMLRDMEFERELDSYAAEGTTELIKFLARQQKDTLKNYAECNAECNRRLRVLEDRDKRSFGIVGGIGAFVGAVLVTITDYLIRR